MLRRPGDTGGALHLVLRRPHAWSLERNPDATARQAAILAHVAAHAPALPAPEVVATEPTAVLMRKLPGRIDLAPRDPTAWLQQQADALRAIHDLPPVPGARRRTDAPDIGGRRPPSWSAHPQRWERALEAIAAGHPDPASATAASTTFVHGDFQHFNLWSRARLTADVADDFTRRYARPVDPWWDLWETVIFLPSWAGTIARQVGTRLGRPVDADAIHRRVDEHLRRVQSTIDG